MRKSVWCKDILLQLSAHWWTAKIVGFRSRCRKALNRCRLQDTAHSSLHFAQCTPHSLCTIFNSWWRQGSILRLSKSPSQHIPTHAGGVCKSLLDRQHCRRFPFGNVIGIILEKKKKLLYWFFNLDNQLLSWHTKQWFLGPALDSQMSFLDVFASLLLLFCDCVDWGFTNMYGTQARRWSKENNWNIRQFRRVSFLKWNNLQV